jgi:hypothetical protein
MEQQNLLVPKAGARVLLLKLNFQTASTERVSSGGGRPSGQRFVALEGALAKQDQEDGAGQPVRSRPHLGVVPPTGNNSVDEGEQLARHRST